MYRNPVSRIFLLFATLALGGCSTLEATRRPIVELQPRPMSTVKVTLARQENPHRVELRNFPQRSAPALLVLDAAASPIASGLDAVDLPKDASGEVLIIVRSLQENLVGRADLWVDGELRAPQVEFSAGTPFAMLAGAKALRIVAVQPPNGAASHVALLLSRDKRKVLQVATGSQTVLRLEGGNGGHVFYGSSLIGPIRTYETAGELDLDRDGLDDVLERGAGTCSSKQDVVAGVDCAALADTRDTDGDGLWDGWEVLGYHAASWGVPGGSYLPLQAWGANPRHKDAFVEVDFGRRTQEDNDSARFEWMPAYVARQWAEFFADSRSVDPALRASHAASVRNPDGQPGIALHLDIGQAPESPADATLYGDWGGNNAVDAVPDPEHPGLLKLASPSVWREQMSTGRHGIFRYVLGAPDGGQCAAGVACAFGITDSMTAAHEFGHMHGLQHFGAPETPSINCKPNYPSLMSYAGGPGFSDGQELGILNNHALVETGVLAPGSELFARLTSLYRYKVDAAAGNVDWNRDGQFAPAGAQVRAFANYKPSAECEGTRASEQSTGIESPHGPAIVKFQNHLWVFAVSPSGELKYTLTPAPLMCANLDDCAPLSFHPSERLTVEKVTGVDAITLTTGGKSIIVLVAIREDGTLFEMWMEEISGRHHWHGPTTIPGSGAHNEPSLAVSAKGGRVALAYSAPTDGRIYYRFRNAGTYGAEQTLRSDGAVYTIAQDASPSIAFAGIALPGDLAPTEHLVGAFIRDTVKMLVFDRTGQDWRKLPILMDQGRRATGRPALAWVSEPAVVASLGAPASPTTYGRLYVLYAEPQEANLDNQNPRNVRMLMSYVDTSGALRIGLDSYFDNSWAFTAGLDLLQPGEVKLRAAMSYEIKNYPWQHVFVRPQADGILDVPYRNYDDWKIMAWASCQKLADVQALPVKTKCAPPGW